MNRQNSINQGQSIWVTRAAFLSIPVLALVAILVVCMLYLDYWKDIPEWKGYYQASYSGHIRSLERTAIRKGGNYLVKEKILKVSVDDLGYKRINLTRNSNQYKYLVSRVVLITFGVVDKNKPEACHNDGYPPNNKFSNLRWDTHKGNHKDRIKHNTLKFGEQHPQSKLKEEDVKIIKPLLKSKTVTRTAIAEMFNVTRNAIYKIEKNITWVGVA